MSLCLIVWTGSCFFLCVFFQKQLTVENTISDLTLSILWDDYYVYCTFPGTRIQRVNSPGYTPTCTGSWCALLLWAISCLLYLHVGQGLSCSLCSSSCCCDSYHSHSWCYVAASSWYSLQVIFLFCSSGQLKQMILGARFLTNSTKSKWPFISLNITHNFGVKYLGSYLWALTAKERFSVFSWSRGYFQVSSFQSNFERRQHQRVCQPPDCEQL